MGMGICEEPAFIIEYNWNNYKILKDSIYHYLISFPINIYETKNINKIDSICMKSEINHLKYNNLNSWEKWLIWLNLWIILLFIALLILILYFSIKKILEKKIKYKKTSIFFVIMIFLIVINIYSWFILNYIKWL